MTIYKENPQGTHKASNDLVEYGVKYQKNGRYYFLSAIECTKNDWGGISTFLDFSNRYATLKKVSRASKKVEQMCNDWLTSHVDELHEAYLKEGIKGVQVLATLPIELNL